MQVYAGVYTDPICLALENRRRVLLAGLSAGDLSVGLIPLEKRQYWRGGWNFGGSAGLRCRAGTDMEYTDRRIFPCGLCGCIFAADKRKEKNSDALCAVSFSQLSAGSREGNIRVKNMWYKKKTGKDRIRQKRIEKRNIDGNGQEAIVNGGYRQREIEMDKKRTNINRNR